MSNRSEKLNTAKKHTKLTADRYSDQISFSVQNTEIYDSKVSLPSDLTIRPLDECKPIQVVPCAMVSAIFKYGNSTTTILNFASSRHPGNGYIRGAMAQEEAFCTKTFLYNVLVEFQDSFFCRASALTGQCPFLFYR